MFVCVTVCPSLRLLITSGTIDRLNKFYSPYMAAVVNIVSRRDLSIDAHHTNQPSRSKPALYKLLIDIYSHLKQL